MTKPTMWKSIVARRHGTASKASYRTLRAVTERLTTTKNITLRVERTVGEGVVTYT